MVTVMKGGEEVKISKRAGSYVTVRDLIDEVGRDAVRYFFLMRRVDSHLVFDIDLAKSQSEDNPVYYVQYAHARAVQRAARVGRRRRVARARGPRARSPRRYEAALAQTLAEFPQLARARGSANSRRTWSRYYLHDDVAARLHTYYNAERFLVEDETLKLARLALVAATRQVLANGLAMLGVSAPERM